MSDRLLTMSGERRKDDPKFLRARLANDPEMVAVVCHVVAVDSYAHWLDE